MRLYFDLALIVSATICIYFMMPRKTIEIDRLQSVTNGIAVKKSRCLESVGAFATRSFQVGDVVVVDPVVKVPVETKLGILDEYTFEVSKKYDGLVFGYGSMINHSYDANVEWEYKNDRVTFRAIRPIEQGDELFHNYGKGYWKGRDIKPTTCR